MNTQHGEIAVNLWLPTSEKSNPVVLGENSEKWSVEMRESARKYTPEDSNL